MTSEMTTDVTSEETPQAPRKDQGRFARMIAFWGLILVAGYGCFHGGGLVTTLHSWMGDSDKTLVDQFPLLGSLSVASLIAIGVLLVTAFVVHSILARPAVATALVETEAEMYKVTWPTWSEAWSGTLAVCGMVLVLFLFLTAADLLLLQVMQTLTGGR